MLMTDVAQEQRKQQGLLAAWRRSARRPRCRVRAVTMTALAAFFAMIPTALALEKGSEANAPLGRAILGGLIAGEPATLFVVPAPLRPDDPRQSLRAPGSRRGRTADRTRRSKARRASEDQEDREQEANAPSEMMHM